MHSHGSGMSNLVPGHRANLWGFYRHHSGGVTVQRHEFHFVSPAILVQVDQHHGADVARTQAVFGQVACKNHILEFVDHSCSLILSGYAITKRGVRSPASINHTERILATTPSARRISGGLFAPR